MALVLQPTRLSTGLLIKGGKAAAAMLIMLGLTMATACAQEKHIGPASSRGSVAGGGDNIESEVSPVIAALEQAVRQSDASRAAALWSVDGEFIDDAGQITRGRHELKERFSRAAGEKERQAFTLLADGIKHPSANVALVDGVVLREKDSVRTQTSRFSMVLIKEEGAWLIARATETLVSASNSHEQLEQLAFLVGQWNADKPNGGASVNFDWAPKGNFIRSSCVFHRSNQSEELSNQVIGWDPRIGKIVSWHFDARGGFAYGQWTHLDNKWIVEIAGITSGGADTTATDVFTVQEPNKFTWQSTKRIVEGAALPDIEPLTVLRVTGK